MLEFCTLSLLRTSCKSVVDRVICCDVMWRHREKLAAWLAKHGKTPSRYRHMMCFGVHGIDLADFGSHGDSDSGHGNDARCGSGGERQQLKRRDDDAMSSRDDAVACSLFTVPPPSTHCRHTMQAYSIFHRLSKASAVFD